MSRQREFKFILNGKIPEACSDTLRWARWFEDVEKRRIAQELVGDIWVSTVFLGIDHGWNKKTPILFETMCFTDKESADSLPFNRYATWDEAMAGHATAVMICRAVVNASSEQSDNLMTRLRGAMEKQHGDKEVGKKD